MQRIPFQICSIHRGLIILAVALVGFSGCAQSGLREVGLDRSSQLSADGSSTANKGSATKTNSGWFESYEQAQQVSRETGKPILANFSGSDWCGWCKKLERDVFSQTQFKQWAAENVVLLKLDYPRKTPQNPQIRRQNKQLADRYNISSYPTVLLLDTDGQVVGESGYKQNPAAWIASVESQLAGSGAQPSTIYR